MKGTAPLSSNQPLTSGGRIQYIDAMRGFTMILVVLQHVASFCWHVYGNAPSVHEYLIQFRMPMFFFISGFVLFKAGVTWDLPQVVRFFKKKIPVQLLSPFVFFALYLYVTGQTLTEGIGDPAKSGYWFTFVLLEYYIFYVTVRFFIRKKWSSIVLLALGLFFYLPLQNFLPLSRFTLGVLSVMEWKYFIFFVLGTIVKEYFSQTEKLLDSKWLLATCVLFYFLVNFFRDLICVHDIIVNLLLSLTGLILIFSFFRKKQDIFTQDKVLGKSLQYIGRRTLDIYLIHYFLIPKNLDIVTVFVDHPMPIIEATASLLITLLIIGGSLLISNIIRLSPFLAHWMFGAKYPKQQ